MIFFYFTKVYIQKTPIRICIIPYLSISEPYFEVPSSFLGSGVPPQPIAVSACPFEGGVEERLTYGCLERPDNLAIAMSLNASAVVALYLG